MTQRKNTISVLDHELAGRDAFNDIFTNKEPEKHPKIVTGSHNVLAHLMKWFCAILPVVLIGSLVLIFRISFTDVAENEPSAEQQIAPEPPFCTPKETMRGNFFYFDLGGTYCVCEKQWSIRQYWEKTLSGLAFNFPHLIDGFTFTLAIGNLHFMIFGIFANEFVEEFLLAITGHWGFNFDPPYDLEPRYDSLMRDIIHCFLGCWLGFNCIKLLRIEPWIRWPIKWDLTLPSSDPHSILRWLKVSGSLGVFWQIFLLYNADGGLEKFSRNNALCTICVFLWFVCVYWMNRHDFPAIPSRRVIMWHAFPGCLMTIATAFSIYPLRPTIYLIMLFEGTAKLLILSFGFVLAYWPRMERICALNEEESDSEWFIAKDPVCQMLLSAKLGEGEREMVKRIIEEHYAKVLSSRMDDRKPFGNKVQCAITILSFAFAVFFIVVGISEPLLYTETRSLYVPPGETEGAKIVASYGRHWCGNPNGPIHSVNTCHEE